MFSDWSWKRLAIFGAGVATAVVGLVVPGCQVLIPIGAGLASNMVTNIVK